MQLTSFLTSVQFSTGYDVAILFCLIYFTFFFLWQSSERVLILEYMDGIRINDRESLEAYGVDKQKLVEEITRAYAHQIYIDGFFNGDPYPGRNFISFFFELHWIGYMRYYFVIILRFLSILVKQGIGQINYPIQQFAVWGLFY